MFSTIVTDTVSEAVSVVSTVAGDIYFVATMYGLDGNWGVGGVVAIAVPGFLAIGAYLVRPVCRG